MIKKTSKQRINEFVEGKEHLSIETDITIAPDGSWCLAKSTVKSGGLSATGHKMMHRRPDADGQKDTTFIGAAETMAVARAIAYLMPTEEDVSQEEFDELVVFTIKRVNELHQISARGAREFVNAILNDELRQKASLYLESLLTKASASFAIKSMDDANS